MFALTIERLGLALAVVAVTVTAALASREVRPIEALALALGLATHLRRAVRPDARSAVRDLGVLMELVQNLATGFGAAVTPVNLGFCLFGCLIGTLIGVLPGIGPIATIAMLLPVTFGLAPLPALIMLAGIYYGAQYGGSTTAILVNLPGESSSVVTCIDGYQMAQRGPRRRRARRSRRSARSSPAASAPC